MNKNLLLIVFLAAASLAHAAPPMEPVMVSEGDGEGANYGAGVVTTNSLCFKGETYSGYPKYHKINAGTKVAVLDIYEDESQKERYTGVVIEEDAKDCKIPVVNPTRSPYRGPCRACWIPSSGVSYLFP